MKLNVTEVRPISADQVAIDGERCLLRIGYEDGAYTWYAATEEGFVIPNWEDETIDSLEEQFTALSAAEKTK